MKTVVHFMVGLLIVLIIPSCMENEVKPITHAFDLEDSFPEVSQDKSNRVSMSGHFKAHLSGAEEVPAVNSNATGQVNFKLDRENGMLHYKLIVANIENVRMAHIHLAPAGSNGSVVVWLYPAGPPPQLIEGRFQGVLAEGTITEANLVGPLAGFSFDEFIEEISKGNTYVNVHTNQFPGGEIRGQIN